MVNSDGAEAWESMKKLTYVIASLAGVGFVAMFFEGKPVEIRSPTGRFWVFCGYAFAGAFAFTFFEEFMKRGAHDFHVAWLTILVSLLAAFFLGAAVARFAYVFLQVGSVFLDPVAAGFLVLSLATAIGIASAKITFALWKSNR